MLEQLTDKVLHQEEQIQQLEEEKNDLVSHQPSLSLCTLSYYGLLLHFARVADDAKCIVVTHVCLSVAVRPHYCTDPDVTWGMVEAAP